MRKPGIRVRGMGLAVAMCAIVGGVEPATVSAAEPAAAAAAMQGRSEQNSQRNGRNFRATRRIVVDQQTGQARMPTVTEVDELVTQLASLTFRPETGSESSTTGGGIAVDLAGGFGGVMLARPNDDGTFETQCVFTFEEGVEFLGLVEVAQ